MEKTLFGATPPAAATDEPASSINPEAAFPTAQWASALRALDAESASPQIGSNVNAGPDIYARTLSGIEGREYAAQAQDEEITRAMVLRTMFVDEHLMAAVNRGVRQIVILAVGLDARAFRLPLPADATVYEVDVPRAHASKGTIVERQGWSGACARRVVEADLAEPTWSAKLQAAGFDPSQRSFFIIEGLFEYLPEGAPQQLLGGVSSLMAPGSQICGDILVGYLSLWPTALFQEDLASCGTAWTWEVSTWAELRELVDGAGMRTATLVKVNHKVNRIDPVSGRSCALRAHCGACYGLSVVLCCPCGGWQACTTPQETVSTLLCCRDVGYGFYLADKVVERPDMTR